MLGLVSITPLGGLTYPPFPVGTPVPALADIGAGFDAIVQFREDLAERELLASIGELGAGMSLRISLPELSLPPAELAYLVDNAPTTELNPGEAFEAPATSPTKQYVAVGFQVDLDPPHLALTPGAPGSARVTWAARVFAIYQETTRSAGSSKPGELRRTLGSGTVTVDASVETVLSSLQAFAWVRLTFGDPGLEMTYPSGLFSGALDASISSAFQDRAAAAVPAGGPVITPSIIFGGVGSTFADLDLPTFRASHVILPGNVAVMPWHVISVCFNFGPEVETGELERVASFIANGDFGCYLDTTIVRAAVMAIWQRLSDSDRTIPGQTSLAFEDSSGATVYGTAKLSITLTDLETVDLQPYLWPGATMPEDLIRLAGRLQVVLRQALTPGGVELPLDKLPAGLREPSTSDFSWTLFRFGHPPGVSVDTPSSELMRLLRRLLEPALLPAFSIVTIDHVVGQVSAAVGAISFRGVFTMR